MAYDLALAERIRGALVSESDVTERKMFGGLAFLICGHMTVVVSGQGGLMMRADPTMTTELVESTSAEFAEMRGRQLQGWLRIDAAQVATDDDLDPWIELAVRYSSLLPPKT